MNPTVARLTARALLGRRRVWLLAALPAVLLVFAIVLRTFLGASPDATVALLGVFGLGTVLPLSGLIVGNGAIGPEIDDGSIVYLLSKPVNRYQIAVTKLVVAAGITVVAVALPMLLAGLVLNGFGDRLALAYGIGAALAAAGYCAVFLLLSVVTRHAVVIGLIYALLWEGVVGTFVPGAKALSIQQWALSASEAVVGDAADRLNVTSAVDLSTGLPLLVVLVAACAAYTGRRLQTLRLTGSE